MSSNPFTGYAAAFDALLDKNRRQIAERFDDPARPAATQRSASVQEASSGQAPAPGPTPATSAPVAQSVGVGDAAGLLNARYGRSGWGYEVVSREQHGDELVVLCTLTLREQDVARSQFGRARIRGGGHGGSQGKAQGVRGTMGGTPFTLRAAEPDHGTVPSAGASDSAEDAFRRALNDALQKCAETL